MQPAGGYVHWQKINMFIIKDTALCCVKRTKAPRCNDAQRTAAHCYTLRRTATNCNTLQHTATHCNTLQHTVTHCNKLHRDAKHAHRQVRSCRSSSGSSKIELYPPKTPRDTHEQHIIRNKNIYVHIHVYINVYVHEFVSAFTRR